MELSLTRPAVASRALRLAAVGCLLMLGGLVLGLAEAVFPYLSDPYTGRRTAVWQVVVGVPLSLAVIRLARADRVRFAKDFWIVPVAFALAWMIGRLFLVSWPNSGDEYGYEFLAHTLLQGRLWNPPPPVPDLFEFWHIFVRNGKFFSQYAPGWPAFLAPFLAAHVPDVANPVLTAALGYLTLASLRRLSVPPATTAALAVLLLFSPFVLFNGASMMSHPLTACLVMAICWLQLRDEAAPGVVNKATIGLVFSWLLLTRYEVFGITAVLFVAERVWVRRVAFWRDALTMAAGGAPLALCFLVYNQAITGNAFVTPLQWANPDLGVGLYALGDEGRNGPARAASDVLRWTGGLLEYAGGPLALLYVAALVAKWRVRTIRFFDLLFPAACVFFFFYPDYGGHQYGPRYWFFAWPPAMLTIGSGLAERDGWLRLPGMRLHAGTLAAASAAAYLGVVLAVGGIARLYVEARREVYSTPPPHVPAVVLLPTRMVRLGLWQIGPIEAEQRDFTRNGTSFDAPVLWGRDGSRHLEQLACSLPGRAVYRWVKAGDLQSVACP
jgi:hypothetical protein